MRITWGSIVIIILFLLILVGANYSIWNSDESDSIKKVDCYDRYNNKIINQVCEEKTEGMNIHEKVGLSLAVSIISILFCGAFVYVT